MRTWLHHDVLAVLQKLRVGRATGRRILELNEDILSRYVTRLDVDASGRDLPLFSDEDQAGFHIGKMCDHMGLVVRLVSGKGLNLAAN
jgi:hypothetical protein